MSTVGKLPNSAIGGKKRFLIIEPQSEIRDLLTIGLTQLYGHHVEIESSGTRAIAKLDVIHFDFVIADIESVDVNALVVADYIREHRPNCQLVIYTGSDLPEGFRNRIAPYPVIENFCFRMLLRFLETGEFRSRIQNSFTRSKLGDISCES